MMNLLASARGLGLITIILAALNGPARAQNGGDSENMTASFATYYARYYAPYALQAAAAYIPVQSFNQTLGSTDGADVRLAVAEYPTTDGLQSRATKSLQPWRFQFGSQ